MSRAAQRRLEAFARDYGAGFERLAWHRPLDAARTLTSKQLKVLAQFRARVARAWLTPDPARALAAAFAEVDPASRIAIYPGAPPGGPQWSFQSVGGVLTSAPLTRQEMLPALRLYNLKGSDPFADTPVTNVPIMRANVSAVPDPTEFLETLLVPNDAIQQLRMVTYDEREVALFAGLYRNRADARFELADHALLLALWPSLLGWHRVAKVLGPSRPGDGALVAALGALDRPALLVRQRAIVYANRAGIPYYGLTRAWLQAERPNGFAQATPLTPGGLHVDLVLPHVVAPPARPAVTALDLSQRYGVTRTEAQLALRLAAGCSVRDAAIELDMAYETARTHLKRVYEKLGVRRQSELVAKVLGG